MTSKLTVQAGWLLLTTFLFGCGGSLPPPDSIEHPRDSYVEVPYPPPAALAETVPTRPDAGGLVWLDGDWNFRGYRDTTKGTDSWGNLEYDTAYVLALTFAATDALDVHEQMVAAARHFTDVDTIHAAPRPEWVGNFVAPARKAPLPQTPR